MCECVSDVYVCVVCLQCSLTSLECVYVCVYVVLCCVCHAARKTISRSELADGCGGSWLGKSPVWALLWSMGGLAEGGGTLLCQLVVMAAMRTM